MLDLGFHRVEREGFHSGGEGEGFHSNQTNLKMRFWLPRLGDVGGEGESSAGFDCWSLNQSKDRGQALLLSLYLLVFENMVLTWVLTKLLECFRG